MNVLLQHVQYGFHTRQGGFAERKSVINLRKKRKKKEEKKKKKEERRNKK